MSQKAKAPKELRAWEKEKQLIPVMIEKYCHGKHKTKGGEVCEECRALTEYALFRLEKCPFKVKKSFVPSARSTATSRICAQRSKM